MNKNSIDENKAIQDGLERFLEEEISAEEMNYSQGEEVLQRVDRASREDMVRRVHKNPPATLLKTEFATDYSARPLSQEEIIEEEIMEERPKKKATSKKKEMPQKKNISQKKHASKKKNEYQKKNPKKDKKKKKFSKLKKLLIFLLILFIALLALWYSLVSKVYNKMNYDKSQELASEPMKAEGVINVLLIGNDSRENGEDGRSDAMILLSISNKTKTIHMTSLLRDMYVDIPGHDGNRLNAAYAYGGATLLCETIEQNLGIEVNRYVLVNFQAFAKLVDAVGGADMDVTNEEVQWINAYLNEYNLLEGRDITTDYLDTSLSGEIHLNGPQALAYSRNRYIGTDFGRTERQRKVLSAVMKKLPIALATNSTGLINDLFPNLTTNLTRTETFGLSLDASKLLSYEVIQTVIPADGTYSNATIRGMSVLEVDYEANKAILQKEIYGKE